MRLRDRKTSSKAKEMNDKQHNKKALIGQNDKGWWAVDPDPALEAKDIDQLEIIVQGLPQRDQLLRFLTELGYSEENIIEGILRL